MAGIPCSDLKNVPTTWSTRWPPALACRTRSSCSYSSSTEKPCPACHPCTTAGHTTGYKAKVPITLRRIQSRSQGYVPLIPKSRTTLQQAQDSVSSHPLTDLTRSTMRTRTWESEPNHATQIQDMPEVDLITIVKMVSKLVPRVELIRVVVMKPK